VCSDAACLDADALGVVGWSADVRAVVFQTLRLGTEAIHVWDLAHNTVRTVTTAEGVFGSMYSGVRGTCALARGEAICLYSAADRPAQVIAIDLATGARRILLDPNAAFSPGSVGVVDKIAVEDRFGRRTLGRLVLPRGWTSGRLPLLVTSYTCQGFLFGGTGEDVPEHVLAGLGYAAVCIDMVPGNVRPSSRFGGAPDQVSQSIADFLEDAVRVLDKRGVADPQRVAIAGFSGSTTGVAFALTQTTRYAAAIVTTTGSADVVTCYLHANTGQCRRLAEQAGYKPPFDSRSGYWSRSPAWHADQIATPLLMQLGEAEHASMLQLHGALLDYDRAVEMVIFAGAHHFKHEPRQRLSVYQRNIDWVRFWLRGETREGMIDQYERWRALRVRHCDTLDVAQPAIESPWFCLTQSDAG
jgi:dipeptidyl aminopeptidase/acylaminoacyl peptidase